MISSCKINNINFKEDFKIIMSNLTIQIVWEISSNTIRYKNNRLTMNKIKCKNKLIEVLLGLILQQSGMKNINVEGNNMSHCFKK